MTRLDITLPPEGDREAWRNREWLVTNGLGGYASGTLSGVCTRRYHGIFVPNLARPRGRHVLVSRLDEEVHCGGQTWLLGCSDRKGEPLGQCSAPWLRAFCMDGNIACWVYQCGEVTLERQLVMPHQRNTSCLRYVITSGPPARLRVRPFMAFRRQDAPLQPPGYNRFSLGVTEEGSCRIGLEDSDLWLAMCLVPKRTAFTPAPLEQADAWLWREDLRGYEAHEACASPGYYEWLAEPGEAAMVMFTTEETHPSADPARPFEEERARTISLVELAGAREDPFLARLAVAADQFLILPESRLEESADAASHGHVLRTVVAGYYWFLDWGRDTMISLEGLMLSTGRHMEARATLLTFSSYVRDGLLPNLFPEGAREGAYHTVDATLWYFHAIDRYLQATGDRGLLEELMPTLRSIMQHHVAGTRFGIQMDPEDGLLRAGAPGNALTWMDAQMGEWIVTPRRGKPVEIQALWYNALRLMQQWETTEAARDAHGRHAALARRSFNGKFWNPAANCLFDVVEGEEGREARVRPNQLFAIALDHPVLERSHWAAVVDTVARELLTPVGLRTLARADPAYSSNYHGNLRSRDAAYHQGTVWPWLLGAFIDASIKVHRDAAAARVLLEEFPRHLHVAGLGSISEVFDGDSPHTPHGCIAQAWSVAEVLRCWKRTAAGAGPGVD